MSYELLFFDLVLRKLYYFTFKIIMMKLCMKILINYENEYLLDKFLLDFICIFSFSNLVEFYYRIAVICTITERGFCLRIQCWFLTSNY